MFPWQAQYFRDMEGKNRKTHWYEAVSSTVNFPFLKEVSQNCFVFDVVNFERKSRRIASFLLSSTCEIEEVWQNCFVATTSLRHTTTTPHHTALHYTTLQLQLHYNFTTTTTTLQLHHNYNYNNYPTATTTTTLHLQLQVHQHYNYTTATTTTALDYNYNYTRLQPQLHYNYTTLHYITLHCTALPPTTFRSINRFALPFVRHTNSPIL